MELTTNHVENPTTGKLGARSSAAIEQSFAKTRELNVKLSAEPAITPDVDVIALRLNADEPSLLCNTGDILICKRFSDRLDAGKQRVFVLEVGYCVLSMVVREIK